MTIDVWEPDEDPIDPPIKMRTLNMFSGIGTPEPFRDLLIGMARSAAPGADLHDYRTDPVNQPEYDR